MWIVETHSYKQSLMLYFMRENVVHFRDDVGTTFVIAVMFLCRVVSPSQHKILLQTAEALELLYLQLGAIISAKEQTALQLSPTNVPPNTLDLKML